MDINCPYCGTQYEVTEQERGQKALCEVCNKKFIIWDTAPKTGEGQDVAKEKRTIKCPHCGTEYEVNADEIGKSAQCEACGKDFVIAVTTRRVATSGATSARKDAYTHRKYKIGKESVRGYAVTTTLYYAENKKYFSGAQGCSRNMAILGLIFAIPILIGGIADSNAIIIGFALALIFPCLPSIISPFTVISDAEIDAQAKSMGNGIEDKALSKIGIDAEEVSMVNPVKFWGYRFVWPSVLGDDEDNKAMWVCGKDGEYRSSEVTHTIFFFGEHSVYCYERTASLVGPASRDSTEEYFYKDIVSVRTDSKTVPWRGIGGMEVKNKSFRIDEFVLTNAGGERRVCEVANPTEAESAAKAFRALLKQKKL